MVIKLLPPEIRDQIAAGEVVERPASVVKELVENAIDAEATEIKIWLEAGGKTQIKVQDDGVGMTADDLQQSVLRHATSKISEVDDLFSINQYGFRGEALAAIASISKFSIASRRADDDQGYELTIEAGTQTSFEPASLNIGSTVEVLDLFYPTPARLQYLKNDRTELRNILKEIYGFALAYPHIGFTVHHDEKLVLDYPPATDFEGRVKKVMPKFENQLIPLEGKYPGFNISGFITEPGAGVANKNNQYLLVNGRRIEDYRLAFAIREGYVQSAGIEKHLHPGFVCSIEVDPILVDVNVHPRKLEVKFAEPGDIFSGLKRSVVAALENFSTTGGPVASFENVVSAPAIKNRSFIPNSGSKISTVSSPKLPSFATRNQTREQVVNFEKAPESEVFRPPSVDEELIVTGQLARKYIVAESSRGVYFFDQHALHERQRFEEFWQEYKAKPLQSQDLLVTQILKFSEEEILVLADNKSSLEALKFIVNFPSDNSIAVEAVPTIMTTVDLEVIFEKLIAFFMEDKIGENALDQIMRKILEYKACRGSVMFGDRLDQEEMEKLISDFHRTDWKLLCPHGRPNHWFIPFEELDQKFHR